MTGHSYIVLLLTLPFLRSHYFISPPIPLFLETLQKTFPKNRDTKKKIYRQIIPPNTYIPLASNTPGVLVSSGLCNTSAFEVFRLISDLEHYKVWAGYGIQSITVSDDMKYGSAIAKYEAGAFGFSFVFSLHWEFFYAQDNKPFYASFRLLEKTNLLDKIEGQYTITAVQNQSICNVDFVLATSLKGVPGFLQRRIKQLVVEVALGELIKYLRSKRMKKYISTMPIPRPIILPIEEVFDDSSSSRDMSPIAVLQRFIRIFNAIRSKTMQSIRACIEFEESSTSYYLLCTSLGFSQRVLSLLDPNQFYRRISTALPELNKRTKDITLHGYIARAHSLTRRVHQYRFVSPRRPPI